VLVDREVIVAAVLVEDADDAALDRIGERRRVDDEGRAPAVEHALAFVQGDLLVLPVTAARRRLVGQFGDVEGLAVDAVHLARESPFHDVHGDLDGDGAGPLAVEQGFRDHEGVAIGIQQFHAGEELQVLAVDGEQFSQFHFFAGLFRIARDDGIADGQRLGGDRFVSGRADGQGTAFGRDAGRGLQAEHPVAHDFEVGDGDAAREHDLGHVRKA